MILLIIPGFIGMIVCTILLLIKLITKKPKKKTVIAFLVCLALCVVALSSADGETENNETELPTAQVVATIEATADEAEASLATEGIEATDAPSMTMGQKNALASAKSYLRFTAFSYHGLIGQLEYEGYTTEEATFAADNCGADWNEQALLSAKNYLNVTAFSYTGLIDQLEYEKFTTEQATYGADNCGADWNEQAAKKAESYLSISSFSRSGLIDQLEFEGFTHEQAVYGVEANGY